MRNKKNYILGLIFLISSSIFAQEVDPIKKFQFGFRVSPNLTWTKIKNGPAENDGTGLGFSYGLMGDYNFSQNYYLGFEALITSMKNKIALQDSFYQDAGGVGDYYSNIKQEYKFQYVQLPITLKMKTNYINGLRYFFQAGIAPGFLITRNVRVTGTPKFKNEEDFFSPNASDTDFGDFQKDPNNAESKEFTNNIGLFRVPLVLGAGVEYKLSGNTLFTTGIRWDNGFSDIFRDKNTTGINNYIGLTFGVLF